MWNLMKSSGVVLLGVFMLVGCEKKPDETQPELDKETAAVLSDKVEVGGLIKKTKKEKNKKKLNLSIPGYSPVAGEASDDVIEYNTLPELFVEKKQGTTLSGGILRDEENENYMDSIQGAEFSVKIKID